MYLMYNNNPMYPEMQTKPLPIGEQP